jgi:5,10-methylene-tetrahydrofolate dehydrogenase/methenyl tetrahydrofolate cyclohydrolase
MLKKRKDVDTLRRIGNKLLKLGEKGEKLRSATVLGVFMMMLYVCLDLPSF